VRTRIVSILLLLLSVGTTLASGQEKSHDGYWWLANASDFKLGFATGFAMAMIRADDTVYFSCIADKNGGTLPREAPSQAVLNECNTRLTKNFDFNSLRIGQLVDGVDQFYSDFRNKGLDVGAAMTYVRDQLKGKPAKELEDELNLWRQPPH